jgi:hypothetical protein
MNMHQNAKSPAGREELVRRLLDEGLPMWVVGRQVDPARPRRACFSMMSHPAIDDLGGFAIGGIPEWVRRRRSGALAWPLPAVVEGAWRFVPLMAGSRLQRDSERPPTPLLDFRCRAVGGAKSLARWKMA